MKQRAVWKVIFFGIITFGIYDLYWLYTTRKELIKLGHKVPRVLWLLLPGLVMVSTILLYYLLQFIFNRQLDAASGIPNWLNIALILLVLLIAVGSIPLYIWWFYKYSQAASAVTHTQLSTGLSLGLAILLAACNVPFVWNGILQDYFNKVSRSTSAAPLPQENPVQI